MAIGLLLCQRSRIKAGRGDRCRFSGLNADKLNVRLRPLADIGARAILLKMNGYVVTYAGRESDEPFSSYSFDVWRDGLKVAELGHDYRGDEHWMRVPGGRWMTLPSRIIYGGGSQPLALSSVGARTLELMSADVR